MCMVTLLLWAVLSLGVVAVGVLAGHGGAVIATGLVAAVVAVAGPVVLSFWRPVFLQWTKKGDALRARLRAEGVLADADPDRAPLHVETIACDPGDGALRIASRQEALLLADHAGLRLWGEKESAAATAFSVTPQHCRACGRCWAIWACGGDAFELHLATDAGPKLYLVRSREGRNLRQAARATATLAAKLGGLADTREA